jgi:hypothetical protein
MIDDIMEEMRYRTYQYRRILQYSSRTVGSILAVFLTTEEYRSIPPAHTVVFRIPSVFLAQYGTSTVAIP